MEYKSLLNGFNKLSVNLKKYYDFIGYKLPFLRGVEDYNFTSEHYEYLKLIITLGGIYICTDKLVEMILQKYNLKDVDEEQIMNYIRSLRLVPKDKFFELNPDLRQSYYAWFDKNKNSFQSELGKIKAIPGKLYRERSGVYHKLRSTDCKDREILLARLEAIKDELSISMGDRIRDFFINQFINSISKELHYITTYKKNRFIPVPYYRNLIVKEELLYYYLARKMYNRLKKEDANDKQAALMLEYLSKFLSDNREIMDSEDNVVISTVNTYMSDKIKAFNVSDFKNLVNGVPLKKS